MSTSKKKENEILEKKRGQIENDFGALKNRFEILSKAYRHDKRMYGNILKICLALDNIHRFPEEVILD